MSAQKFLIVRLGAMGDVLHAMPAVAALKSAVPGAEIHWVVDPRWAPLLGPSLVDQIHLADTRSWSRSPLSPLTAHSVLALRRQLRTHRFNAVIDLQGSIRSAVISRFARSKIIIGSASPRETPARWLYTQRVTTHTAHVIEQAAEITSAACNVVLAPAPVSLPHDAAAERWCDNLSASSGAAPIALIAPGAGWGAKRWPPERYGEVAAGLATDGLRVLINCGPAEEAMAQTVVAASGSCSQAINAALPQLIALLRRTNIFIGGDTGPLHLAAALGVPIVGLYGPTDPARNGPYATHAIVLRHATSRRDHTRHAATEAGLMSIPAAAALAAARKLLQQSKSGFQNAPAITLLQDF